MALVETTENIARPISLSILGLSLVAVFLIFGTPMVLTSPKDHILTAVELVVIGVTVWRVGAWAIVGRDQDRRMAAAAGLLLIAPLVLFSLMPGYGPPQQTTAAQNVVRYLILIVAAIAIAGGFVVLRDVLGRAGEAFFASLGFAAIIFAGPMDSLFAAIEYVFCAAAKGGTGLGSHDLLNPLSGALLFFATALTYLATAAFALSLRRVGWIGRISAVVFVTINGLAFLCLVTRGVAFPDPSVAFQHWYTIPGWVVGIPAMPWLIPAAFGVIVLARAGRGTLRSTAKHP
jgi:hypothetical protein